MPDATLVFLVKGNPPARILLGMKKRGFAAGKFNGFGGKVHPDEPLAAAAARELAEETGVAVAVRNLRPVARLEFRFPAKPEWDQVVYTFLAARWRGVPVETEEMRPVWFDPNSLPYGKMWADDAHWLPLVLQGKHVEATFTYNGDNETIAEMKIDHV